MKISNVVKNFLINYSHLIDEGMYSEFLNGLYEQRLKSDEVIKIISILNSLNPPPINKEILQEYALKDIKKLLEEAQKISPEGWEDFYYSKSFIDEDGDLLLEILLNGFDMHTYGFTSEDLIQLIRSNRDYIGWDGGEIYAR